MSLKNKETSTKVVIYQTGNKREAERKFKVKYSARTILLVLLGKSFINSGRFPVRGPRILGALK